MTGRNGETVGMRGGGNPEHPSLPDPVLVMRGIRKSFGPVEVLHGVDFRVFPGEVHVLAGENGAGKSTLIKVLSGVYSDFSGEVVLEGRPRRFSRPADAVRAGVATIHQELSLIPTMSVSDNLFLGRERRGAFGAVAFAAQETATRGILEETGLAFSPSQEVGELPISSQQILEIARALARNARLLVFDEPTSALNEREAAFLFERIEELRRLGRGIVYITHRLDEIYRLADRITVLRDGRTVGTALAGELPQDRLVEWMVGRSVSTEGREMGAHPGEPLLEVADLRVDRDRAGTRAVVDGIAFELRKGEILGLAGLQGSGASEVLHGLFGALGGRVSGAVRMNRELLPLGDPRDSVARGILLLTNDRKTRGLAPHQSVTHSMSLAGLSRFSGPLGWIKTEKETEAVQGLATDFRLTAPSLDAPVRTLSGGNQQKVYLARCLLPEPRVLLLDEPTRGIDVGAKADIYRLMRGWVGKGISILLITSEMDELLALSHRVLVLHRGRVACEFAGGSASKESILAAAMGQEEVRREGGAS
jgi:ABC-type sugar transport system ATPase subunit